MVCQINEIAKTTKNLTANVGLALKSVLVRVRESLLKDLDEYKVKSYLNYKSGLPVVKTVVNLYYNYKIGVITMALYDIDQLNSEREI